MRLPVLYIVLLSLQTPFHLTYALAAYLSLAYSSTLLPEVSQTLRDIFGIVYLGITIFYFAALVCIGIKCILDSFRAYRDKDVAYCMRELMVLKYGGIPFFIVNFASISVLAFVLLVASRGLAIFAAPMLLLMAVFWTWFAMLPGAFFGIQVVRFTADAGKMGKGVKVLHIFSQFIFFLDVLDTAYLTVFQWKKGKLAAAVVCCVYVIGLLLVLGLLRFMAFTFF